MTGIVIGLGVIVLLVFGTLFVEISRDSKRNQRQRAPYKVESK